MKIPSVTSIRRVFAALLGDGPWPEGEGVTTSFEHSWRWPGWVTLLVVILAAVIVVTVYLHEQGDSSRRRRLFLAAVRTTLLLLTLFMMYGWTKQHHRTDLPELAIILDDSESMAVEDRYDEDADRNESRRWARGGGWSNSSRFNVARSLLLSRDRGWLKLLAADYRLKLYLAGPSTRGQLGRADQIEQSLRALSPHGSASMLGNSLREVLNAQRGRPTAAVVMLTDGVTTEGVPIRDAAASARRKSIPLFLVGIGSDRSPKDVRLSDLLVDEVVFVDEMVHFDVRLHAEGYGGQTVIVRLRRSDREGILAERRVVLSDGLAPQSVRLAYRPVEEGDFEYVVEVLPLEGELILENNRLTQRVLVRNATLRVLFVQAYPSYEYRFLKDLLERAVRRGGEGRGEEAVKAIQLTAVLQEADLEHAQQDTTARGVFPVRQDELFAYDVLVFGDVDPALLGRSAMENISGFVRQRGGGLVLIAGPSFTPLAYRGTPLASLFPVDLSSAALPSPESALQEEFVVQPSLLGLSSPPLQIGETSEDTQRVWRQLPALRWLLTAPDVRPAARVLAVHPSRKGPRGEPLPVIAMQFVGAGQVVLHNTDETYRWSRFPGDPNYYARYWLQTLRYLSRSKLTSPEQSVEISSDRQQYRHGDIVRLRVRFLQDRQVPPENDGVTVVLQHVTGRRHQVTLVRDTTRRDVFEGTIAGLPDGQYRAWLSSLGEQSNRRHFSIAAAPGEQARIAMDSQELRQAAKVSLGKFYSIRTAYRLPQELPRGRRVTVESLPPQPIWNSPLIAAAFVGLLTVEWLVRKRAGML